MQVSAKQLAIMKQRHVLLSDIRIDRLYLKRGGDLYFSEREEIEARILAAEKELDSLPVIEVAVTVVFYQENQASGEIRIITTDPNYIVTAVARACALNPYWAREVQDSFGEMQAFVTDVWESRPLADLVSAQGYSCSKCGKHQFDPPGLPGYFGDLCEACSDEKEVSPGTWEDETLRGYTGKLRY